MAADQRILTLDADLDDPRAEDASFKSTRTLLEHQVVLWKLRDLIYEYGRTTKYQGCPCFSENGTAEFLRDEKRRAREMLDFLALGRLLVVLVPPPQTFYEGPARSGT